MKKFYDTCALLELQEQVFDSHFLISNITLKELELIKSSSSRDFDIKYKARKLIHLLDKYEDEYTIINYIKEWDEAIKLSFTLFDNNDSKIIMTALQVSIQEPIIFITSDLNCKKLAQSVGLNAQYLKYQEDIYTGFKEISYTTDEELAEIYNNLYKRDNPYNLLINEYILINNSNNNEIIDKFKYTENGIMTVPFSCFESKMFGKIKPKDVYQAIAMDSLKNNQFTILQGEGGTGKTLISLAYLFQELEKNHIHKIIIAANPWAAKNSAKLGFTPGDLNTKILDTQIGNILTYKIGDRFGVERLIQEGKLELIPFSNLRGASFDGDVGFYVTEAQNLDSYLCQLAIQRCGENTKIIFEGDSLQTDSAIYEKNNGITEAIKTFKGENMFGYIKLKNIYRSQIANIASRMEV